MLKILDAIQDKLGIENDEDLELSELEADLKPQDVLKEIEHIESSLNRVKRRAGVKQTSAGNGLSGL